MSKKLDGKLEEIAEDFGQRCAESALDFSWFDAEGLLRGDVEYAMAVALRAMNCGYGWEFDGQQLVVQEWDETQSCRYSRARCWQDFASLWQFGCEGLTRKP
jgi:hypothetical protein